MVRGLCDLSSCSLNPLSIIFAITGVHVTRRIVGKNPSGAVSTYRTVTLSSRFVLAPSHRYFLNALYVHGSPNPSNIVEW
ncbi:hypothetical protein TNCV_2850211 [Trichonephila clavipes]|nr:hypothetical protein TNCV_2850211 [Trichonephila clavipes]